MKTVYLVRHAKSSWKDSELSDIDRPLKAKGVEDAYGLAELIAKRKICPDLMLASTAVRAFHTGVILARQIEYPVHRIKVKENIYESNKEELFEELGQTTDDLDSVMIVGHDPALTNFANHYIRKPKEKIPTSSVLCLKIDSDTWKNLKSSKGKLDFFETPKDK
ncbi:MAG: histidine phosphatase family protein [Leptolyngbya sp. SIO3F4]|nr:histidine phosphatase family protein [Leptolyngbya sp. SIO3F4]